MKKHIESNLKENLNPKSNYFPKSRVQNAKIKRNPDQSFSFNKSYDSEETKSKSILGEIKNENYSYNYRDTSKNKFCQKILNVHEMKQLSYSKQFFLSLYDNWKNMENKIEKFKRKIARKKIQNIFGVLKKKSTKCFTNFILRSNTDFKRMFTDITRFEVRLEYAIKYRNHMLQRLFFKALSQNLKKSTSQSLLQKQRDLLCDKINGYIDSLQTHLLEKNRSKSIKSDFLANLSDSSILSNSFECKKIRKIRPATQREPIIKPCLYEKPKYNDRINTSKESSKKSICSTKEDIQKRSEERKEKLLLIKKKHEEEKERKRQEKINEEEKMREEHLRKRKEEYENYKLKKKKEQEVLLAKKAEEEEYQRKWTMSIFFHNKNLMKNIGMKHFRDLIILLRKKEKKAIKFYKKAKKKQIFGCFKLILIDIKREKELKEKKLDILAENFHERNLKKFMIHFLKAVVNFNKLWTSKFINIRSHYLKRMIFSKWFENLPDMKINNINEAEEQEKIIKRFRFLIMAHKVFKAMKKVLLLEKSATMSRKYGKFLAKKK